MSNPQIELHIAHMGSITLELDADKAPKTVANFLQYLEDGHYDGTIFHRIIPGFMVQGGGMSSGMKQKKTHPAITNEADNGLKNVHYSVAMARTSAPHSATAQFFINTADNDFLNFSAPTQQGWGYAVFGKVISGTEIVDAMEKVATGRVGMSDDVPLEDVLIEKAVLKA
ncbi:MAG: peptidyl-prolyl cis-trans isomerase [Betaproteobacteria bacterium]|nr:peptidyl-prolyl cis-trans isomerase [Betaproteobacteria bacterium]